jgi:hypothetical protein
MKRRAVVMRLVLLLWLAGCGSEDIVVANIAPSDADADTSDVPDVKQDVPGPTCRSNGDCEPNEYCERPECVAPKGGCQLRPIFCSPDRNVVCGCDGVTYWNDCLRRQRGATLAALGECKVPAKCRFGNECPGPAASCARIVPGGQPCPPDLLGFCWVLPEVCPPPDLGEPTVLECGPANTCRTPCDAIRSGAPHRAEMCVP